jgi:hypothetical protein
MTSKSMTLSAGSSPCHRTEKPPLCQSVVPQFDHAPDLYFHRVRVDSETAKESILRLFSQKGSAIEPFARSYDSANDPPEYRSSVKLGVCWKLLASPPKAYQRTHALPHTLDSPYWCLRDVFGAENPITTEQEDLLSRIGRQLDEIKALPDFATLTLEALNGKLLHVFVPEDSPTREELVDSVSAMSPCLTREEVGVYLRQLLHGGLLCRRQAFRLVSRCWLADYRVFELLSYPYWGREGL